MTRTSIVLYVCLKGSATEPLKTASSSRAGIIILHRSLLKCPLFLFDYVMVLLLQPVDFKEVGYENECSQEEVGQIK